MTTEQSLWGFVTWRRRLSKQLRIAAKLTDPKDSVAPRKLPVLQLGAVEAGLVENNLAQSGKIKNRNENPMQLLAGLERRGHYIIPILRQKQSSSLEHMNKNNFSQYNSPWMTSIILLRQL
jgi:hypothetical protein